MPVEIPPFTKEDRTKGGVTRRAPEGHVYIEPMNGSALETKNLRLLPHAPEHLRALIQGPECYARSFGLPPAEGLWDYKHPEAASPQWLAALQAATEADPWTHGFAVVHPGSPTVIGLAGFKGPPSAEGVVEIAYAIAPDFRGKGYATEVAQALVDYALVSGRVRVVCAHTLAEANASTRVLTKCGFRQCGEVVDPDDGRVWRWEKPVTSET